MQLCHCITALSGEFFSLISNLNFLWLNLRLLPLILLLLPGRRGQPPPHHNLLSGLPVFRRRFSSFPIIQKFVFFNVWVWFFSPQSSSLVQTAHFVCFKNQFVNSTYNCVPVGIILSTEFYRIPAKYGLVYCKNMKTFLGSKMWHTGYHSSKHFREADKDSPARASCMVLHLPLQQQIGRASCRERV